MQGVDAAEKLLGQGIDLYLYLLDEAVRALDDERAWRRLEALVGRGLKLYVCAFSAEKPGVPRSDRAVFSGLVALSQLIAYTDAFFSFDYRPENSRFDALQPSVFVGAQVLREKAAGALQHEKNEVKKHAERKKIWIVAASNEKERIHEALRVAGGLSEVGHAETTLILAEEIDLEADLVARRLVAAYQASHNAKSARQMLLCMSSNQLEQLMQSNLENFKQGDLENFNPENLKDLPENLPAPPLIWF